MKIFFLLILSFILISKVEIFGQRLLSDTEYKNWKTQRSYNKYKFSKKSHKKYLSFEVIDTNAIYIHSGLDTNSPSDSVYKFLRFYKNSVYWSAPYTQIPDSIECNNINYGIFASYKINRKGYLIIERAKIFQMDSRWIYFYGIINKDYICLTHYYMSYPPFGTSPGKINQNDGTYIKKKYSFTIHTNEWEQSN